MSFWIVVGVLVVQTFEHARFKTVDVQTLANAARILGPIISPLRESVMEELKPANDDSDVADSHELNA